MFEQMHAPVAANVFVAAYALYCYTCADLNEGKFPIGKGGGGQVTPYIARVHCVHVFSVIAILQSTLRPLASRWDHKKHGCSNAAGPFFTKQSCKSYIQFLHEDLLKQAIACSVGLYSLSIHCFSCSLPGIHAGILAGGRDEILTLSCVFFPIFPF